MTEPPQKKAKLWGGRFSGATDPRMEKFNESLSYDKRMWKEDIEGSIAYSQALVAAGILTKEEGDSIKDGLEKVRAEWQAEKFVVKDGDEDIHTANERRLTEIIGPTGGKLHTGRSRNDQVATDVRLWLRAECAELQVILSELIRVFVHTAEEHVDVLMAGTTHLQPAQPVRFSHWLLSHAAALQRDSQRLADVSKRVNVLPLGSGALAGHAFGIDRRLLAKQLGFAEVSLNSIDATCDRDFIAEFMWWGSMTMVHLSQLAEDLIINNTMRCIDLADAYSTGSSLMPQKKNPDALELLRGKTGRVLGNTTGFMTTLKGLPRAYNKDLQEDKEALFDTADTMKDCILIATGVIATLKPKSEGLRACLNPQMLATDLAEYLVRKGVPFRETHHVAGQAVQVAENRKVPLNELTLKDLQGIHSSFEQDVMKVWDYEASVERKDSTGGTSRRSVLEQCKILHEYINCMGISKAA